MNQGRKKSKRFKPTTYPLPHGRETLDTLVQYLAQTPSREPNTIRALSAVNKRTRNIVENSMNREKKFESLKKELRKTKNDYESARNEINKSVLLYRLHLKMTGKTLNAYVNGHPLSNRMKANIARNNRGSMNARGSMNVRHLIDLPMGPPSSQNAVKWVKRYEKLIDELPKLRKKYICAILKNIMYRKIVFLIHTFQPPQPPSVKSYYSPVSIGSWQINIALEISPQRSGKFEVRLRIGDSRRPVIFGVFTKNGEATKIEMYDAVDFWANVITFTYLATLPSETLETLEVSPGMVTVANFKQSATFS